MGESADAPEPTEDESPDPFAGPAWIGRYSLRAGSGGRIKMSDRRRTRRRMQRRTGWLLLALGGLMVLTAAWVTVTGLLARHDLNAMKSELSQLRGDISTGNIADAKIVAADLARHAHSAHGLTTGPAWWAPAGMPVVGDPLRTARGISAAADSLGSQTVPKLIEISAAVDPARLKLTNHKIDVSALAHVTPQLDAAVANADRQRTRIAALPSHTWLPAVNAGATDVAAALGKLVGSLDTIDQAVHAAPTMLGYSTPQRYFVAFQNEAETRGTGGLPGAFAIVEADHGTLTFTHFGNDSELEGVDSGLDFGAAYNQTWHDFEPTKQYLNSNVDPDFRYAGQIWAAMWQRKSGEHVDGAVALDPTALSYFLAVTGPAALPDGSEVSSKNIVALTQSNAYARFPDQVQRKAYLLQVAEAADRQILSGSGNAASLFKAASRAAGQRRLLLWSGDKQIESVLSAAIIGGAILDTPQPYAGVVVLNYGANKLDYYLTTRMTWQATGCGPSRDVVVTVTLTNHAPADLPSYVAQRLDNPDYPTKAGDSRVLLYYVGTEGGDLDRLTTNGEAGSVVPGTSSGHPTYSTLVELPRGQSTTVVLHLQEPASSVAPIVLSQPQITPGTMSAKNASCA